MEVNKEATDEKISEQKVDEFFAKYGIDVTNKTLKEKTELAYGIYDRERVNIDWYDYQHTLNKLDGDEYIQLIIVTQGKVYLAKENMEMLKEIRKIERKKNFGKIITNFKNKVKSIIKK